MKNKMNYFHYRRPFTLESGEVLPEITIAYHTYGQLNDKKDNAVWVCHALTANSNAEDWWKGVVGTGTVIDPQNYFIVCANILGSCYGTTGPLNINPTTTKPYYSQFPLVTIRDMVKAHQLLREELEIQKIRLLMGGSMGGYQALEWALMEPSLIQQLFLIATSARETPWGIAIHTAQRLAIEADGTWNEPSPVSGQKGLKAARAIGMITYRSYNTYILTQSETDLNKVDKFKAASYINHQGNKLVNRFNAYSYWFLTKSLDSHNIARSRANSITEALQMVKQPTLIIAISSDVLCPLPEMELLSAHIPNSTFHIIDSTYGHDGFLVETEIISRHLELWLTDG
ncbi:MAG: homoserine O-acetyltransferase [Flavisolibacter sp.]